MIAGRGQRARSADLRVPEVLGLAVEESADGSFGTSVRSIGFAGCRAYGEHVFR